MGWRKNWNGNHNTSTASFIAPPGLDREVKRTLFRDVTDTIAAVYNIRDHRNILVFLNEHPLDNVASNGFIQTENPAFESPATMQ